MKSAILIAVLCFFGRSASAMELQMFDRMAPQDQQDYIKHVAQAVEQVLRQQGQLDTASMVDTLFRRWVSSPSTSEFQFWNGVLDYRFFLDVQHAHKWPFSPIVGQVEDIFVNVLIDNQIVTNPFKIKQELIRALRENPYWPKRTLRAN